jgi:hypothetical protein
LLWRSPSLGFGSPSLLPRTPSLLLRSLTRRPRRIITTRRPPIGSLIPATPCTTTCTLACTSERPPRSFPVIVRVLVPIPPPSPASPELAESAGFVNEKPPVSSCDIGGRQSGRPGSNRRHSAWERDLANSANVPENKRKTPEPPTV